MGSEIRVTAPNDVLEVSRALQAVNRSLLELQQQGRAAERTAARLIANGLQSPANRVNRTAAVDPWRGAVPEFEPTPITFPKRFGRAAIAQPVIGQKDVRVEDGRAISSSIYTTKIQLTVWTGQRNTSLSRLYDNPPTTGANNYLINSESLIPDIALPLGNGKCIIVLAVWLYADARRWSGTGRSGPKLQRDLTAFLCGPDQIKEIQVKGVLANILTHLFNNLDDIAMQNNNLFPSGQFPSNMFTTPTPDTTLKEGPDQDGPDESIPGSTVSIDPTDTFMSIRPSSPEIFSKLHQYCVDNNIPSFVTPQNLQVFPSAGERLYTDTLGVSPNSGAVTGFYQGRASNSLIGNENSPYYYIKKADAASSYSPAPNYNFSVAESAPRLRLGFELTGIGGTAGANLYTATILPNWDWRSPAYCRNMCLALGFTAEDLSF